MSEIKKVNEAVVNKRMNWVVMGSNPGGRNFLAKKISNFFGKKYFPGVFKWFCLYKKVSLTTLGPSGRLSGVRNDPRRPQIGPQNAQNDQK
jgi:hypothetical protein